MVQFDVAPPAVWLFNAAAQRLHRGYWVLWNGAH